MRRINLSLLLKTAKKSKRVQRHASIVFIHGNPITFGFNNNGMHAEDAAVWERKEYKNATMVNIRLTKANRIALAKPCPACLDLLKEKKFRKVIYSTNEGSFEEIYL